MQTKTLDRSFCILEFTIASSFPLIFLILISLLINLSTCWVSNSQINVIINEGNLNEKYNLSVKDGEQMVVRYVINNLNHSVDFMGDELRMEVEIMDNTIQLDECPILFTLSQGKYVSSWDLPHQFDNKGIGDSNNYFYSWAKSVCVDPKNTDNRTIQVVTVVSTCHQKDLSFTLRLLHTPTLRIPLSNKNDSNGMVSTSVSPTAPKFYKFEFPSGIDTVLIVLSSEDNICMTLSIQSPNCPVFDEQSNIRHSGFWQTFTKKAGLTVERKSFPKGFFLVLVVNTDDDSCTNKEGYRPRDLNGASSVTNVTISQRVKEIEFQIERSLHQNEYLWPILFPWILYIPILFGTFGCFTFFHRASFKEYTGKNSASANKTKCPLRSEIYMCSSRDELDERKRDKLEGKSQRYFYLLVTVALFYCTPVFQLIINYLGIVYRTGEQDICYFNNLCSLPLNKVMDFNHIYSNVGYVIFGGAFIFFTILRQQLTSPQTKRRNCLKLLPSFPRAFDQGTFEQYGLFYALGFALLMEGFLSSSYHICPNKANFQFDTSFMYAMAVLSYVKVYQFRHSLYTSELTAFLLLALVTASVVVGLFSTNLVYNIVLSLIHLILVIFFQMYLLYISRIPRQRDEESNPFAILWGITKELIGVNTTYFPYLQEYHPNKGLFWWTILWNILLVINSWTLVYGTNFATQVLYILLANLSLYVFYYFIMKIIHLEFQGLFSKGFGNPSLQPVIYMGIALLFMITGMYYFMNPSSTWDLSPAQSRGINERCVLFQFYDNHDLWHFLSAPGLFFSFMVFLTIDDGLITTHQESIPVF